MYMIDGKFINKYILFNLLFNCKCTYHGYHSNGSRNYLKKRRVIKMYPIYSYTIGYYNNIYEYKLQKQGYLPHYPQGSMTGIYK